MDHLRVGLYEAGPDGRPHGLALAVLAFPTDAVVAADGAAVDLPGAADEAASAFPAPDGRRFAAAPGIDVGWPLGAGGVPVAPPPAPLTADALIACANGRQRALATGGFTVTIRGLAITFDTDEGGLARLDRKAMRLAQPNPPATVNWQTGPTRFAEIAADDFAHAAALVEDFHQATFDALPAIFAGIAAGTVRTAADIDAAAWPAASVAIA